MTNWTDYYASRVSDEFIGTFIIDKRKTSQPVNLRK
jgi:hypothetical protein